MRDRVRVVLFGATGMIGGGVLTECLDDPAVRSVVSVGRAPSGRKHPKLRDLVVPDLFDLGAHVGELGPFDACLFCLGVSSAGMSEEAYRRVTVDLTVAVADVLERLEPDLTTCFISGAGSGSDRVMWARVKGEAEDALLARGFTTYVFRPGFIRPMKGARSRTTIYQAFYTVLAPLAPAVQAIAPNSMTRTDVLGRAMIRVASEGYARRILETSDINALGASSTG